jgi:hypothetical protein
MGTIKKHLPVKLFTAITFLKGFDIELLIKAIEQFHSPIDLRSEVYDFTKFTTYYNHEMGEQLNKCFVSFLKLFIPENLPFVKISTNRLEEDYISNKKRQINIDPGYITQAKLVLATTKNYSHRIYLGQGIYGDVHLQYQNKTYQPQPWTYPDYKDINNLEFFNATRLRYLEQLADL